MKGLVLVDVPEHNLKCGQYGDLPDDIAEPLSKDGRFDTQAPDPENAVASEEKKSTRSRK
jgi:hypothetical protein